jgi:hypothetical protein
MKEAPALDGLSVAHLEALALRVRQEAARYLNAIALVQELVAAQRQEQRERKGTGEHMNKTNERKRKAGELRGGELRGEDGALTGVAGNE